jgi:hypothetical protein
VSPAFRVRAVAARLLGKRDIAVDALRTLEDRDPPVGAKGQAELAIVEGRWRDAERVLVRGLTDDTKRRANDAANSKRELLVELALARGDRAKALSIAATITSDPPRVGAGLVLAAAGDEAHASAIAKRLQAGLSRQLRAGGKLIEGELQRSHGDPMKAMVTIDDSLHLDNSAFGHFLLARAALDAKHYAEASSELAICSERRGELAWEHPWQESLVPYYLAKAREGLGTSDAAAAYQEYLARVHEPDDDNPLVRDARAHVH